MSALFCVAPRGEASTPSHPRRNTGRRLAQLQIAVVVSTTVASPAFHASSWLAHSSECTPTREAARAWSVVKAGLASAGSCAIASSGNAPVSMSTDTTPAEASRPRVVTFIMIVFAALQAAELAPCPTIPATPVVEAVADDGDGEVDAYDEGCVALGVRLPLGLGAAPTAPVVRVPDPEPAMAESPPHPVSNRPPARMRQSAVNFTQ